MKNLKFLLLFLVLVSGCRQVNEPELVLKNEEQGGVFTFIYLEGNTVDPQPILDAVVDYENSNFDRIELLNPQDFVTLTSDCILNSFNPTRTGVVRAYLSGHEKDAEFKFMIVRNLAIIRIYGAEDRTVKIGELRDLSFIYALDNVKGENRRVEIEGNIDFNKAGEYPLTASATAIGCELDATPVTFTITIIP